MLPALQTVQVEVTCGAVLLSNMFYGIRIEI